MPRAQLMRTIYLDYNATTPIAPPVREAIRPYVDEMFGNPSSAYALGRAAHEAVEDARQNIASLIGANSDEIILTSGGSESNNLALKGILLSSRGRRHLVISAIEHPSVRAPAEYLRSLGCDVTIVACNAQGRVEPHDVETALRPDTALVSVMHANNEVGTIQPISQIAAICRRHGVLLHCDASQSAGKIPVHVDQLQVDLLTLAGHKLYAPKGIGALYVRGGVNLVPLVHGAGHELGRRAGTENVPWIVGLGRACQMAMLGLEKYQLQAAELRQRLWDGLRAGVGEGLVRHGDPEACLPNTLMVSFPRVSGHALLEAVPELCASTGSACHTGSAVPSPTLAAMGIRPEIAQGAVRLSVGWYTSGEDIDRAVSLLLDAWERLLQN